MATATKGKLDEKQMLIGGSWQGASDGKTFESLDPADRRAARHGPRGDGEDVDAAVDAARAAFESDEWRGLPAAARAKLLWRVGELIDENMAELAELETRDQGKPIGVSQVVIPGVAEHFRYYAGWVTKIEGETPPRLDPRRLPLHAARADRRLRADHPLELPDQHRELEDRPGARLRQHRGGEARGAGLADHPPPRRADPGGGHPRRRAQRRHRRPRRRAGAGGPRRRRQDLLHRLDRGRPRDRPRLGRAT